MRQRIAAGENQLTIEEFPQIAIEQGVELAPVVVQQAPDMTTPVSQDPETPSLQEPAMLSAHEGLSLLNTEGDVIMLEEAEKQGLLKMEADERSGGYVIHSVTSQ